MKMILPLSVLMSFFLLAAGCGKKQPPEEVHYSVTRVHKTLPIQSITKWPSEALCAKDVETKLARTPGVPRGECIKEDGRFDKYFVDPQPNGEWFFVFSVKDENPPSKDKNAVRHDYEIAPAEALVFFFGTSELNREQRSEILRRVALNRVNRVDPKGGDGLRNLSVDLKGFGGGEKLTL